MKRFRGFPGGSAGKEPTCNAGDLGLIPVLGRSPGEGKSYPFKYSGPEKSLDHIVHGVAKSWTQLSDVHIDSSAVKNSPASARDAGSVPWSRRSPAEGNGNPL